jgi:hypothetical protein
MDNATVGVVGLILVILGHIFTTIWWAATITANLKTITVSLDKISLADSKNDDAHKALWREHDLLKNRVTAVETRCSGNHKDDHFVKHV